MMKNWVKSFDRIIVFPARWLFLFLFLAHRETKLKRSTSGVTGCKQSAAILDWRGSDPSEPLRLSLEYHWIFGSNRGGLVRIIQVTVRLLCRSWWRRETTLWPELSARRRSWSWIWRWSPQPRFCRALDQRGRTARRSRWGGKEDAVFSLFVSLLLKLIKVSRAKSHRHFRVWQQNNQTYL